MNIQYRRDLHFLLTEFNLPKVVAEVGVAEGLFSNEMLQWGIDKIYCVDNWGHIRYVTGDGNSPKEWHTQNYEKAKALLAPYDQGGKVVWLKGLSSLMANEVADESLGLVYLDADHSHKGEKRICTSGLTSWLGAASWQDMIF